MKVCNPQKHKKNKNCINLKTILSLVPEITDKYLCPHCNKIYLKNSDIKHPIEWDDELEELEINLSYLLNGVND